MKDIKCYAMMFGLSCFINRIQIDICYLFIISGYFSLCHMTH